MAGTCVSLLTSSLPRVPGGMDCQCGPCCRKRAKMEAEKPKRKIFLYIRYPPLQSLPSRNTIRAPPLFLPRQSGCTDSDVELPSIVSVQDSYNGERLCGVGSV